MSQERADYFAEPLASAEQVEELSAAIGQVWAAAQTHRRLRNGVRVVSADADRCILHHRRTNTTVTFTRGEGDIWNRVVSKATRGTAELEITAQDIAPGVPGTMHVEHYIRVGWTRKPTDEPIVVYEIPPLTVEQCANGTAEMMSLLPDADTSILLGTVAFR
jgi:hypothetical protein